MTQMPLLAMSYDVANRMIVSDHSSAGITYYGYNHANQRVYTRKDDGVDTLTYMLYGLGGERLLEMEEQCGGNCWDYEEKARWIYFAGRKMFQKTGSTLKAIAPNRLASEAKHFPYGETDGTPPSDTKDYFATYRRDGTGLDYAWNRYYSPAMGRFTTADPYRGSVNGLVPSSWNRYHYTYNDPINSSDPSGLDTCGQSISLERGGATVRDIMLKYDDFSLMALTVWHEAGPIRTSDLSNLDSFRREQGLIGSALLNRFDMANGRLSGYNSSGQQVSLNFGVRVDGEVSLQSVILQAAGNNQSWGIFSNGTLRNTPIAGQNQSPLARLNSALNSDFFSAECYALFSAITHVDLLMNRSPGFRYGILNEITLSPTIVLFWNGFRGDGIPDGLPQDLFDLGRPRGGNGNRWYGYDLLPYRRGGSVNGSGMSPRKPNPRTRVGMHLEI